MIYILGNSVAILALAFVVWITGFVLLRRLPFEHLPADLRTLARFCLGTAFWIAAAFALAAIGGLHRTAVAVIGLIVLAAGVQEGFRRGAAEAPTGPAPRSFLRFLPLAGLAAVATPLFILAMSPEVSWDANVYHLTLPRIFAARGNCRPLEMNVYSNWPLNTELLFALAILVRDYVLAKLVHFSFGVLTLYAIVVACRGSGARLTTACLAGALFLANPVVVFEFHRAYVDLGHAFFFLAAFVFLVRAREPGPHVTPCLALAGVSAGLMAGVKLTGIVGAVILAVVLLAPRLSAARDRSWELGRIAWAYALPVALLALPWPIRSWWYTGNPVYPLLHSWFGGPDWSAALSRQLQAWQHGIGMGRTLTDYLLLPVRLILMGDVDYDRFSGTLGAFWIVTLPLSLFFVRGRPLVRSCLLVAASAFAFWAATSQQMRLLIPVLPFVAIASAVAVAALVERLPRPSWRPAARGLAVAAGLALVVWNGWDDLRDGVTRVRGFRSLQGDARQAAVAPVFEFINDTLPETARLLFINTNLGFRCERDFIADSFFEASQIAEWLAPATSPADVRRLLAGRRITHLLIHGRDWGIDYPPALYALLRDRTQTRVIFQSADRTVTLVELIGSAPDGLE